MTIFRVTKRTLCFGTGDPSPEWIREVRAESRAEVLAVIEAYRHTEFITVREIDSDAYSIDQFHGFMRAAQQQEDHSREATDEDVRQYLGGLDV